MIRLSQPYSLSIFEHQRLFLLASLLNLNDASAISYDSDQTLVCVL